MAFFIKILKQKCESRVRVQVIQTLSMLVINTANQSSIFYILSNNHINDLIVHPFDFDDEDILSNYASFLKTLSLKLTKETLNFFFNEKAEDFPLYAEAMKFSGSRGRLSSLSLSPNSFLTCVLKLHFVLDDLIDCAHNFTLFHRLFCFPTDPMVRVAVRVLALNVFKVDDTVRIQPSCAFLFPFFLFSWSWQRRPS